MILSEALVCFREDYIWAKGFSKSTDNNYRWAIASLMRSVGDKKLEEITLEDIKRWRHLAENNHFDRNAVISYLYKYRTFFRFFADSLSFDPEDVDLPRPKRRLPRYLTFDEVQRLFATGDIREKALVALLYSSAMRVGELVQVRRKDIQGNQIIIRGKGDSERRVFLDQTAQDCLRNYLATRIDHNPFLFYTAKHREISKGTVQTLIRELGVKAKIDKHVTPHILRHSWATHVHMNGCGLRYVQVYLGHADISTTQMYTNVADSDMAEVYAHHHQALSI